MTEENKFDVILGRAWIEKMGVKWVFILLIFIILFFQPPLTWPFPLHTLPPQKNRIDPLDQTVLTYMDTGEPIACDVVVLKDEKGDIITIT